MRLTESRLRQIIKETLESNESNEQTLSLYYHGPGHPGVTMQPADTIARWIKEDPKGDHQVHVGGEWVKATSVLGSGAETTEPEELELTTKFAPSGTPEPPPPLVARLPPGAAGREKINLRTWFGGSKIRNKDGTPLRMYHGTNAAFSTFRVSPNGLFGPGIYFTDNPELAAEYTEGVGGFARRPGEPGFDPQPNIIPAYLRVVNPFVINAWSPRTLSNSNLAAMAKDSGHDGIVMQAPGHPFSVAVVFQPWQIKSAVGNEGGYDPQDPDITKESRMPVRFRG